MISFFSRFVRRNSPARPVRHTAFTLIELLVVIAIISILASMIFPSFSRARESARRIDCISNLKQVGTAVTMYVNDYDERYPIGYPFWSAPSFVPNQPQLSRNLFNYTKSYQVWNCKSWTGVYRPDSDEGNYSFVVLELEESDPSSLRNHVFGVPNPSGGLYQRPISDAALQEPTKYPLLFCGSSPEQIPGGSEFHGHTLLDDNVWGNGAISGTNVLYADMHAKWWKGNRGDWHNFYETRRNGSGP
jgi:prepilin-type N-terminal cleavage/methylation domain-containing protein